MFDNLKLIVNTSKDPQIVFTDYFYRRFALSMITAYNQNESLFLPETLPAFLNEYENNILKYSSGLYRDSSTKTLKFLEYVNERNRTIKEEEITTIGLNPLFYRVVYGMFTINPPINSYYQICQDNYYYYSSGKYSSWYYYNSSNNELTLFYPPTWHINPAINVESSVLTENYLIGPEGYNILYAVPFGNIITTPKITLSINSSSVNPINNTIDIYIENNISVSDLKSTEDNYLFNGQFCLTSMAIVDIFGQPLILATFPLKPLSESISLKDEYIISLGIPYLQP